MQLEDWERFNVFRVADLTRGRPLEAVTWALLQRLALLDSLPLDPIRVRAFLRVRSPQCRQVAPVKLYGNHPYSTALTGTPVLPENPLTGSCCIRRLVCQICSKQVTLSNRKPY